MQVHAIINQNYIFNEQAIDTTMVKAKALEGKIDITNKQLETSNKQLKDLVKKVFG